MSENIFSDFIDVVLSGIPVKSGVMMKDGVDFFDTPYESSAVFNTGELPYIIYQEEGFEHWITGKMVTKNKGFISQKITGQVNKLGWSMTLGLPFNAQETDDTVLKNQDDMLTQLGVIENV